jgi:hypothetical protein
MLNTISEAQLVVTPNPSFDHEPNLATVAQIVAEMLTHVQWVLAHPILQFRQ